eukprot:403349623
MVGVSITREGKLSLTKDGGDGKSCLTQSMMPMNSHLKNSNQLFLKPEDTKNVLQNQQISQNPLSKSDDSEFIGSRNQQIQQSHIPSENSSVNREMRFEESCEDYGYQGFLIKSRYANDRKETAASEYQTQSFLNSGTQQLEQMDLQMEQVTQRMNDMEEVKESQQFNQIQQIQTAPQITSSSMRFLRNNSIVRGDVKFKMVIRCVIKFYKRKFDWIRKNIPMTKIQEELLEELFTHKNYQPRTEKEKFKSFNTVFREWLFSQLPFCKIFNIFYNQQKQNVINRAIYHYGEIVRPDFEQFIDHLHDLSNQTLKNNDF